MTDDLLTALPLIAAVVVGLWAVKTAVKVSIKAALLPIKITVVLAIIAAIAYATTS